MIPTAIIGCLVLLVVFCIVLQLFYDEKTYVVSSFAQSRDNSLCMLNTFKVTAKNLEKAIDKAKAIVYTTYSIEDWKNHVVNVKDFDLC